MQELFGLGEIIKLALKIESNTAAFYDCLKEAGQFYNIKQTFTYLADEERRHIEELKTMLNSVKKIKPIEDYAEEVELYIKALTQEIVCSDDEAISQLIREVTREKEAINFAVGFEKDSLLFYDEIKDYMPQDLQKTISEIIRQERQHLMYLKEIKR